MEKVTGIGGIFFKARDPQALYAWYCKNLGITPEEGGTHALFHWRRPDGDGEPTVTVWSTFDHGTDYFGSPDAQWMVNYQVSNLDAMLAQLRAAGCQVDGKIEEYEYGRFGWATDPEGNRFELWEPPTGS